MVAGVCVFAPSLAHRAQLQLAHHWRPLDCRSVAALCGASTNFGTFDVEFMVAHSSAADAFLGRLNSATQYEWPALRVRRHSNRYACGCCSLKLRIAQKFFLLCVFAAGETADMVQIHSKSRHVAVLRHGHLYVFDLVSATGKAVSEEQLLANVRYLWELPPSRPASSNPGLAFVMLMFAFVSVCVCAYVRALQCGWTRGIGSVDWGRSHYVGCQSVSLLLQRAQQAVALRCGEVCYCSYVLFIA